MDFIGQIIDKATSDATLIVVAVIIGLVVAGKPMLKSIVDYYKAKNKKISDREDKLLKVIQGNSEIMAELKSLLLSSKEEQIKLYGKVLSKTEGMEVTLKDIEEAVKLIRSQLL